MLVLFFYNKKKYVVAVYTPFSKLCKFRCSQPSRHTSHFGLAQVHQAPYPRRPFRAVLLNVSQHVHANGTWASFRNTVSSMGVVLLLVGLLTGGGKQS